MSKTKCILEGLCSHVRVCVNMTAMYIAHVHADVQLGDEDKTNKKKKEDRGKKDFNVH